MVRQSSKYQLPLNTVEEAPDFEKANESTVGLIRGAAMEKGAPTGASRSPGAASETYAHELKAKKLPALKGGARAYKDKGSDQRQVETGVSAPRRSPALYAGGGCDTNTLYYQTSGPKEGSLRSASR